MNKIKKGDSVIVIAGKDKDKKGAVLAVYKSGKLLVEGINTVKKHTRANPNNPGDKGGIVLKTLPIQASNVMLYDTTTEKGRRVGIKTLEDGRKVRYFKGTDEIIDV